MIASLRGKLLQKSFDGVVVDVGGVGYRVFVSAHTLASLPTNQADGGGAQVELLCHTHVREDALALFGFASDRERQLFLRLIAVSGVGPKLAITILSGLPAEQLVTAIAEGDHRRLQKVPGVGKRTAERLVVELREVCQKMVHVEQAAAHGTVNAPILSQRDEEAIGALVALGYKRSVAEKGVAQASQRLDDDAAPETLLRDALAVIAEL